MTRPGKLRLSGDPAADELISSNPFALLVGMVLDQQIPLEKAFSGPKVLSERLGTDLVATGVAALGEDELVRAFSTRPALHRFPASMARRVHALALCLVDEYGGEAASLWTTAASGDELLRRLRRLPGFGEQKAKIFVALLGKQLGVRPAGWQAVSAPFGEVGSLRSIADITSASTLDEVRREKRAAKEVHRAAAAPAARPPRAARPRSGRGGGRPS